MGILGLFFGIFVRVYEDFLSCEPLDSASALLPPTFVGIRDGAESRRSFVPEVGQVVVVDDEAVREHVAPGGGEQVNLLKAGQFVAIEFRLVAAHVRLDAAELVQLLERVRIEHLADIFHPQQSASVVVATLLHLVHPTLIHTYIYFLYLFIKGTKIIEFYCEIRERRVLDGSLAKRLHFLVQTSQWRLQIAPLLGRVDHHFAHSVHHLAGSGFVVFAVIAQEIAERVFLLRQNCFDTDNQIGSILETFD